MAKMVVELEWDGDDLGPMWMNLENLALCLYNAEWYTHPHLITVKEISHSERVTSEN